MRDTRRPTRFLLSDRRSSLWRWSLISEERQEYLVYHLGDVLFGGVLGVEQRAFDDQCVKYFKNDRGQAIRSYLAVLRGVAEQLGQGLETGDENLRLEPGE